MNENYVLMKIYIGNEQRYSCSYAVESGRKRRRNFYMGEYGLTTGVSVPHINGKERDLCFDRTSVSPEK